MSYELRKILGNRYVMLLLALAVAVNAALFYRRCTEDLGGFTRADVRAEYAHLDTLEQEYDALLNGIYGEDVGITQVPDEDLRRYALLSTVRDEVETTKNYPEYLRGLCAETEAKLRLGLFSADPFAERTLEKGLAAYSALLGVRLEPSFPDGVEVLLDWRLTDLLLLLFAAVSGLVLLTGERSAGLMVLLRPTRRGHGALYWRKAAAMLATVLAGVVLLYGANLAVSAAVLGLGDPARPIQTIPSMQSCPVPLTVFGWLLCFVGEKLLWGWAVGALFFLLCTTTGRAWAAFLLAGGGAGLALLLGSRGSLWPRLLSLSRAAEVEESWRGCIYLNFFGLPLRQTALLPAMLLLLTVGGCLGGAVVFCRTQAVQPVRQRRGLPLPRLRHTVLLAYEARKLLLTGGALLVLAVFVLVQVGSYRDFRAYFNADEWFYRAYSEKLAGEPTPEKNAYLASETARFAELQNELADYARITEGNEDALQFMARDVLSALRAQDGFEKAKQQYEQLQPGQSYVYETGYNVLLGYFGVQKDLLDLAKLFFFLTVALSAVFAMEQETGVAVLQTAAGANGRVLRRKLLLTAVLVLLMVTAAFLPRLLAVHGAYGLPEWGAQANSLPLLSGVPAGWRIRTVLGLRALMHVLLGAGGAAVILLLSRKTRSTIQTMLIAAGILVVPTVAAALLW